MHAQPNKERVDNRGNRKFSKEDTEMAKYMKRCSISLSLEKRKPFNEIILLYTHRTTIKKR